MARGPPAEDLSASVWTIDLTDPSAHQISLGVVGTDLVLTVNGITATRALQLVSSVLITGAADLDDTLTLLGPIGVPVTFDGGDRGFDSLAIEGSYDARRRLDAARSHIRHDRARRPDRRLPRPRADHDRRRERSSSSTGSAGDDDIELLPDPNIAGNLLVRTTNGTIESHSFAVPSTSLTINGGDGDDSVTISGAINLGGASLTIDAERILVAAGSALTTTGDVTLAALARNPDPLAPAAGELRAEALVDGAITASAVRITATVEQTVGRAGETIAATLAFAITSVALAEVRAGALVSAATLELSARTEVRFSLDGTVSTIVAHDASLPASTRRRRRRHGRERHERGRRRRRAPRGQRYDDDRSRRRQRGRRRADRRERRDALRRHAGRRQLRLLVRAAAQRRHAVARHARVYRRRARRRGDPAAR